MIIGKFSVEGDNFYVKKLLLIIILSICVFVPNLPVSAEINTNAIEFIESSTL